jgi:hypothetical protein
MITYKANVLQLASKLIARKEEHAMHVKVIIHGYK